MIERLDTKGLFLTYHYDSFNIDLDKPLAEQLDELDEDIIQLEMDDDYIVNLGYHPSHTIKGEFKVEIIKKFNREQTLWTKTSKTPHGLFAILQEAVNKVKKLTVSDEGKTVKRN